MVLVAGFLLAVIGILMISCRPRAAVEAPAAPPHETNASFGKIFGITLGSPMEEARRTLDPLRIPSVYTPDQKERSGRRIYWKLKETPFDWIMIWANGEGRITRLRAVYRPESTPPFADLGDLRKAASATEEAVKWNLQLSDGSHFRFIAQGAGGKARTIYMFALDGFREQMAPAEAAPEEED